MLSIRKKMRENLTLLVNETVFIILILIFPVPRMLQLCMFCARSEKQSTGKDVHGCPCMEEPVNIKFSIVL